MTAEQIHQADPNDHDVIHRAGEAVAVVVPMDEYLRLRALARHATPEALAEAEDEAALQAWKTREAAGHTTYVPADEVRARLGLPAR